MPASRRRRNQAHRRGCRPYLLEEKHLLVKKKSGVIEYVPETIGLDQVGGVPYLKRWLLSGGSCSRCAMP